MRISDWSSDVCSSDLDHLVQHDRLALRIGQLDADDGAPWDRRDARRQCRHVARDVVGQVGNAARLRARRGFEFVHGDDRTGPDRSEEHTSELQSLMRISYAVFCLKKKTKQ